jgi:hypothetical protein
MNPYHKIQTVFLRDPETKFKTLLEGQWAKPEFEDLANNWWEFEEKIDGTNIRVMIDPNEGIGFRGKSDDAQIPKFLEKKLEDIFWSQCDKLHEMFPEGGCLYGEGFGARIQKGGGNYIKDGVDFCLFDVRVGHWWLKREAMRQVAIDLGIAYAPVRATGTLWHMINVVKSGFDSVWGPFKAEGLIGRPALGYLDRPALGYLDRSGQRIITKLKHSDFPG